MRHKKNAIISKTKLSKKQPQSAEVTEEQALEILAEIALIELLRIHSHETSSNSKKTFKSNV